MVTRYCGVTILYSLEDQWLTFASYAHPNPGLRDAVWVILMVWLLAIICLDFSCVISMILYLPLSSLVVLLSIPSLQYCLETLFPDAFVKHLPSLKLDHSPLLICTRYSQSISYEHNPFRFQAMWLRHKGFSNFGYWEGDNDPKFFISPGIWCTEKLLMKEILVSVPAEWWSLYCDYFNYFDSKSWLPQEKRLTRDLLAFATPFIRFVCFLVFCLLFLQ